MTLQVGENPETGETLVLVGDQWQKAEQTADNDKGEKAYLVGGKWLTQDAFNAPAGGGMINPNINRQGIKGSGASVDADPAMAIGGAGVIGGALGAAGQEILSGAAKVAGAFPLTRAAKPWLEVTGAALRNAGRVGPAIVGAQSGMVGEAAGQVAESMDSPGFVAEAARFVGGSLGPGASTIAAYAVRHKLGIPAIINKLKEITGKEVQLSEAQRKLLESEISKFSAGTGNDNLEYIGSLMGAEGQRLMADSDRRMMTALTGQSQVGGVGGYPARPSALSDIGAKIRERVVPQYEAADEAQKAAYTATEGVRDKLVSDLEGANRFVSQMPEFKKLVSELQAELDNSSGMKNTPAVQAAYRKILGSLVSEEMDVFGQAKPTLFTALDQERRQLGEAFRGKPDEGYAAMGSARAKELYGTIRDIQVKYAGGKGGAHDQLLADYAADIPGLQKYTSKIGKKVTGLDQYREGIYATDPKDIPAAFFKSKQSFKDLVELTGDVKAANAAALEYADRQLAGKNAEQVGKWASEQEWLPSAGAARMLVTKYADRLAQSERQVASATEYAKRVNADAGLLLKQKMPSQKAVDLVEAALRGEAKVINMVAPVISQSPQAKEQMLLAVRRVVSENALTQSSAKNTAVMFDRNLRPMLEQAGLADRPALDFIAERLKSISAMKVPEPEKLGMAKRLLLQGVVGWTASIGSRGWSKVLMIPE